MAVGRGNDSRQFVRAKIRQCAQLAVEFDSDNDTLVRFRWAPRLRLKCRKAPLKAKRP